MMIQTPIEPRNPELGRLATQVANLLAFPDDPPGLPDMSYEHAIWAIKKVRILLADNGYTPTTFIDEVTARTSPRWVYFNTLFLMLLNNED